jgi:hypothetical protein
LLNAGPTAGQDGWKGENGWLGYDALDATPSLQKIGAAMSPEAGNISSGRGGDTPKRFVAFHET